MLLHEIILRDDKEFILQGNTPMWQSKLHTKANVVFLHFHYFH